MSPPNPNRRQKAKDLIELATNEGTPDKERIAAAVRAVGLIKKYDLLSSPLDVMFDVDNETAAAVGSILNVVTDPGLIDSVKKISERFTRKRRR